MRVGQANGGRKRGPGQVVIRFPPVNDEAIVDPELDALVRLGDARFKGEDVGRLRVGLVVLVVKDLQEARPPNREALAVRERERAEVPRNVGAKAALGVPDVEIDPVLGARRHGHGELHVIIVGGVEAGALREGGVHLVVALYRGEVRDLVAAPQGKEAGRGNHGGRAQRLDRREQWGPPTCIDRVGLLRPEDGVAGCRIREHGPAGRHGEEQIVTSIGRGEAPLPSPCAASDDNEHVHVVLVKVGARERLAARMVVGLVRVRVLIALGGRLAVGEGIPASARTRVALGRLQDGIAVRPGSHCEAAEGPHRLESYGCLGANLGEVVDRRGVGLGTAEDVGIVGLGPGDGHSGRDVVLRRPVG